jgi:hypothetical protein
MAKASHPSRSRASTRGAEVAGATPGRDAETLAAETAILDLLAAGGMTSVSIQLRLRVAGHPPDAIVRARMGMKDRGTVAFSDGLGIWTLSGNAPVAALPPAPSSGTDSPGAAPASRPVTRRPVREGDTLLPAGYPDWFLDLPLSALGLSRLLGRSLGKDRTIRDLTEVGTSLVTSTKGLGTYAVLRLRQRVADHHALLARRGGADAPVRPRRPDRAAPMSDPCDPSEPLVDLLARHIPTLDRRGADVLRARLGLGGHLPTLDELSLRFGVTRERIRQIQEDALERIDAATGYADTLRADLAPFADKALAGTLTFREVMGRPWGRGLRPDVMEYLLTRYGNLHHVTLSDGRDLACVFTKAERAAGLSRLAALLADAPPGDPASHVVERYADAVPPALDRQRRIAIAATAIEPGTSVIQAQARFGMWGVIVRRMVEASAGSVTVASLRDAMRAEGIACHVADRKLDDLLREHALSMGIGSFVPVPDVEVPKSVIDRCAAVMRSGAKGRRWRTTDILAALGPGRGANAKGLDPATLEAALVRSGRFDRVRPQLWRPKARAGSALSLNDTATAIVEEAGRPMGGAELRKALLERWGDTDFPQIHPGGRLCLVARSLWGLADRDIPVDPGRRAAIVAACLAEHANGNTTLDGMLSALSAPCAEAGIETTQVLGTILRLDAGFATSYSDALRPPDVRPEPRRGSLKASILALLSDHPEGLTRAMVIDAVERETGKRPSDAVLSQTLKGFGRRLRRGLWVRGETGTMARIPPPARDASPRVPKPRPPKAPREPRAKRPPRERMGYPKTRKFAAPRTNGFKWTPERVAVLLDMAERKRPSREILAALGDGVTKSAVIGKLFRMGLSNS